MLTSCFWVPGISFANGVIMLKSLCAGRLEVLERSSFDEVPSVFVFAIWADFAQSDFFSFMCAEMWRNSSIYADFYQKKTSRNTTLEWIFGHRRNERAAIFQVQTCHRSAATQTSSKFIKFGRDLQMFALCVFFLPHWNQNRILDHSWYVNALTKCLAFVAMERHPAAMNAVAPVGPVRAVNSVTFARQLNRLDVFF